MTLAVRRACCLVVALSGSGLCSAAGNEALPPKVERAVALKRLVADGTADSLAAAALLKQFGAEGDTGSYDLAARAVQLAPDRRDLAWLAVRMCNRAEDCKVDAPEEHLRKVDPNNGVVWFRPLAHAQAIGDAGAIDSELTAIADAGRVYVYFDPLVAATAPKLAVAQHVGAGQPGQIEVGAAAQEMIGVIAASVLPPSQSLAFSCKGTALEAAGRRERCRRAAQAAEHCDTFIMEGLGLSLQQRLWPLDSVDGRAISSRRRVYQYRLEEYGRLSLAAADPRKFPIDIMSVLRAHEREQDAALVYFASAKIPVDPPPGWVSTMPQRVP